MVTGSVRNTGLGIAREFAAAGANLIINGRKEADTVRVAKEIRDEFNVEVIEATFDISRPEQVNAFFDSLESENVKLDVLVNNAVIQAVGYSFIDTPYELLEQTLKTNTMGLFHCSQRAARIMKKYGGGAIVNVGSNTAERAIKGRTAYIASKGAVNALSRAMAVDLSPYNIRVNTVVAGYIHSDRWSELTAATVKRRRKNIPLGKECLAADIARAVMFMASDACSKVTGSSVTIDGGTSIQLTPEDCDC